jgi:hypothetical protein
MCTTCAVRDRVPQEEAGRSSVTFNSKRRSRFSSGRLPNPRTFRRRMLAARILPGAPVVRLKILFFSGCAAVLDGAEVLLSLARGTLGEPPPSVSGLGLLVGALSGGSIHDRAQCYPRRRTCADLCAAPREQPTIRTLQACNDPLRWRRSQACGRSQGKGHRL